MLTFGATSCIERPAIWDDLRHRWPMARIVACSSAGEIAGTRVSDDSVVATAVAFESAAATCASVIVRGDESHAAGRELGAQLDPRTRGLRHVFVLSDGLEVNGSELVRGLVEQLPSGVSLTGGLAGDGTRFQRTSVSIDRPSEHRTIAAIGFYGASLHVGFGSLGGWDAFGPVRLVTRSRGAVLYELDGQPALPLYKRYLGAHARQLPSSGLLFPLALRCGEEPAVVRTILAVDESAQSVTFAGDVPEGAHAQLMHANFDRLIDGAAGAARTCHGSLRGASPELALLISCVGRKLVLQQRIEEEVEAVQDVLGSRPTLTGFYSYGEISPFTPSAPCELHNQTMTITTLLED